MAFLDDLKNMFLPQMGNNSAIDPGTGLTQQQLALMRGNFLMDTGMRAYALGMQQTPEQRSRIAASFANNSMLDPARMAAMQNAGLENQIKKINLNALINEQSGLNEFNAALKGINQPNSSQGISQAAGTAPVTTNSVPPTMTPETMPPQSMDNSGTVNIMGVPLTQQQLRILQAMPIREGMETFKAFAKEKLKDSRTDLQKNYDYARKNPDFEQYQIKLKQAGLYGDPNLEMRSTFNKERMKDLADFVKLSGNFDDSIRSLDVMDMIVGDNPDLQGFIKGRAAEFFPETTAASATFESLASDAARKLYVPGTGQQSNFELQNFQKTLPKLRNTPNGNKAIIQILRAKAQINQETVALADAFSAGEIDFDEMLKRKSELAKRSLITPELKSLLGRDNTILSELTKKNIPSKEEELKAIEEELKALEGR